MIVPGVKSGLRVLVADDDADTVECTALLFCLDGHDVATASNGFEALEIAKAFLPHMILLDIAMPKLDGYEVARRLRRSAYAEHSLLVAVTGYAYPKDKRSSAEAGFDFHLSKPVDFKVLDVLIRLAEFRIQNASAALACCDKPFSEASDIGPRLTN